MEADRQHAQGLPVRALVIGDTVLEPWGRFLRDAKNQPVINARFAPLGQVQNVLRDGGHESWADKPDLLIVWTTPERAIGRFAQTMRFESPSIDALLAEVDDFADAVISGSSRARTTIVFSWALPPHYRGVQSLAMKPGGASNLLMQMNLRLAERLGDHPAIVLLDLQQWAATLGTPTFDPKLFALAKVRYSRDFFIRAAGELKAVLRGMAGQSRKLIICDLDNTLWGGIIGDDGLEGIRLGGHDGVGESYLEFQRELLSLRNRGILLALCSKNDQRIALDAIQRHPEMLLRPDHFAAVRINWNDKAANIGEILRELNLLPSSAVFLDDHPAERDRVRTAFPEMLVPQWPEDPAALPSFLASMDCFETPHVSPEDRARAEMMRQESRRRDSAGSAQSMEKWLESLEIQLSVRRLDRTSLARAAQLLNKTNQFNMSTRRMEAEAFWAWCTASNRQAWIFSVTDRFGESGLTGLITAEVDGQSARLADFVLSCRVMGKQIEEAMLHQVWRELQRAGVSTLHISSVETGKNRPCLEFLQPKLADGDRLNIDAILHPPHIAIEENNPCPMLTESAA